MDSKLLSLQKTSYSKYTKHINKKRDRKLTMSRKDYRSLTIPTGLYAALEQYMEQSKGSYVSIAEVVREALRAYLQAHK